MVRIPDPHGLRSVGIVLVLLTKLADTAVSVWALLRIDPIIERNGLAADVFATYGVAGMVGLTALSLALLFLVIELSGKYIKRKTHGEERTKNLQTIYLVGYWIPGTFWMWVTLNNGWLVWTLIRDGHVLVV